MKNSGMPLMKFLSLIPKPGNSLDEGVKSNQYIMPDFFIYNNNEELELQINSRNMPELRLSRNYVDMLETYAENKSKIKQSA
jgi:RNA polymerase sigma-54 factor